MPRDASLLAPGEIEGARAPSIWRFVGEWGIDDPIGTTPPPRDWLLTRPTDAWGPVGVLSTGEVGMLAGAGGIGKSWALIAFAVSVVTGRRLFDAFDVPKPGPVALFLGEEDHDELWRRLVRVSRALGLDRADRALLEARLMALPLHGKPVTIVEDTAGATHEAPFLLEMRDRLARAGVEWRAVILDPLSRFSGGETEVSNTAATRFVQSLETLTQLPGRPTVIVSHHTTKEARKGGRMDQSAPRGASGLTDGVRWLATLGPVEKHPQAVMFRIPKSNHAPPTRVLLMRGRGGALRGASVEEYAEIFPEDDQ